MNQGEAGRFLGRGSTIPATILTDKPHDHKHHQKEFDLREVGPQTASVLSAVEIPPADRVRSLARLANADGVAYQSVAVAGVQVLERVLDREKAAASAALSLAQREKLFAMVSSLEQTLNALRMTLSSQGSKMLLACTKARIGPNSEEHSWWFALTEAIQALEEGIDAVSGIVSCQPKGGPARILSGILVRMLHRHHNELLSEAENWIG